MPLDQPALTMEPVQFPVNTAICDAPFPIQETLNMHQFSPAERAEAGAGAGQFSPAEATMALSQYSPLEGAFISTQPPPPQADLEPKLPVQSTSTDSGMTSGFVLEITDSVTVRHELPSWDDDFVVVCVYFQALTSLRHILRWTFITEEDRC